MQQTKPSILIIKGSLLYFIEFSKIWFKIFLRFRLSETIFFINDPLKDK